MRPRRRPVQLEIPRIPEGRGGWRPGAGRKRGPNAEVAHRRRERFPGRFPLHVTLRVRPEVGSLRRGAAFRRIQRAFLYGHDRFGMRLVHFSVLGNHMHLIVEAEDHTSLSRGVKGLAIRVAKGLNQIIGRRGQVFRQRYHTRILRTPSQVKNAVHYVLRNQQQHLRRAGIAVPRGYVDYCSSQAPQGRCLAEHGWVWLIVAQASTWLLARAAPSG